MGGLRQGPIGIPSTSMGMGRFGIIGGPPNATAPSGSNVVTNGTDIPWYQSGPLAVLIMGMVIYVLWVRILT